MNDQSNPATPERNVKSLDLNDDPISPTWSNICSPDIFWEENKITMMNNDVLKSNNNHLLNSNYTNSTKSKTPGINNGMGFKDDYTPKSD